MSPVPASKVAEHLQTLDDPLWKPNDVAARSIERELRAALRESPELAREAYMGLGLLAYKRSHLHDALDFYEKARRLDPKDLGAIYNIAVVLAELGRLQEARDLLLDALDLEGGYCTNVLGFLADVFFLCGHTAEAIQAFQEALRLLEPGDADALVRLSARATALGLHHEAVELATRALLLYERQTSTDPPLVILQRFQQEPRYARLFGSLRPSLLNIAAFEAVSNALQGSPPQGSLTESYQGASEALRVHDGLEQARREANEISFGEEHGSTP